MSFDYNEALNLEQQDVKKRIVLEILKDYSRPAKASSVISKVPMLTNLDGFIDLAKELIDLDQETADQRIMLLDNFSRINILEDPENPQAQLSGAVLTSVNLRAPGTMAGGNTFFNKERREIKPRIREVIYDDPDAPGQAKVIMSQWFDNEVLFNICARTNKRSNELASWFEDLMEKNKVFFAINGILKYYLERREKDYFEQIGNECYEYRPHYYVVRTEKTYTMTEQTINRLVVSLTTK